MLGSQHHQFPADAGWALWDHPELQLLSAVTVTLSKPCPALAQMPGHIFEAVSGESSSRGYASSLTFGKQRNCLLRTETRIRCRWNRATSTVYRVQMLIVFTNPNLKLTTQRLQNLPGKANPAVPGTLYYPAQIIQKPLYLFTQYFQTNYQLRVCKAG